MASQFADILTLFLFTSLVTGLSLMSISSLVLELWQFFYKGLTRNLEIGNTPVWVLLNIWRLGQVRETKFGTYISNQTLLMLQSARKVLQFTISEISRENQQTGWNYPSSPFPPRPRLGLNYKHITRLENCCYF